MTNLDNLIRLKNLNYADLVNNLCSVCRGSYNLPTDKDELTTVNNEISFKSWKDKLLLKYPNANVKINSLNRWYDRVKIVDPAFSYEKSIYMKCKNIMIQSSS